MKNYINLTNFNKEELDEFLTLIQDEKEALKYLDDIPTIGFDNYTFKYICKNNNWILTSLIYFVTGIDLRNEKYTLTDAELLSGINLKTQICDFYINSSNRTYDYGIDIESDQRRLSKDNLFDRALLSACKIYVGLHKKKENYSNRKRSIIIYFLNDKYAKNASKKKNPLITTKLVDIDTNPQVLHDNIIIYRINVKEAIKYGFKTNFKNDKILIEALEVLSTNDVDKYLNSKHEVIKTMAEEIKKVNADKVEHRNAILEEIHELRYDLDMGTMYRDGKEDGLSEGEAEGRKKQLEETIKTLFLNGLSKDNISKYLNLSTEYIDEVMKKIEI